VPPSSSNEDRSAALAEMLARVALGDRAAFERLYRATSSALLGVIVRIQRDRAQAEDLLQDVFVNIWRAAQGFDATRAQPMTWLISIARNRAIDSLRRQKTEPRTVSSHGHDDDGNDTSLIDAVPSDAAGPLELLQDAAQARAMTRCIGVLSAEQQQCVALAYYQGLSHSEVAQHLAQPIGTVKSWVRRALLALKDCLSHGESPLRQ